MSEDTPDNAPAPLAKATLRISDGVAKRILNRIAQGELIPGQRLPSERQLAQELDVSRVSVRTALQTLKAQGFLSSARGGGTRVVSSAGGMDDALTKMVSVKLDNLYDLAEIRIQIETWAARRAAERGNPEQIAAIGQIVSSMTKPGVDRSSNDMDFHLAIARAASSPVYMHILTTIREILHHMVKLHHSAVFPIDETLMHHHHRAIFEAIAQRQPHVAAETMRVHLKWLIDRYREIGTPLVSGP